MTTTTPGDIFEGESMRVYRSEASAQHYTTPKTSVVNLRDKPPAPYVRIDRRTKWGNPFKIEGDITRLRSITLYAAHLVSEINHGTIALRDIRELSGKTLACWCAPEPCHGEVLAAFADRIDAFAMTLFIDEEE